MGGNSLGTKSDFKICDDFFFNAVQLLSAVYAKYLTLLMIYTLDFANIFFFYSLK